MAFAFKVLSHTKCHLVLVADCEDAEEKNDCLHLFAEETEPPWGWRTETSHSHGTK